MSLTFTSSKEYTYSSYEQDLGAEINNQFRWLAISASFNIDLTLDRDVIPYDKQRHLESYLKNIKQSIFHAQTKLTEKGNKCIIHSFFEFGNSAFCSAIIDNLKDNRIFSPLMRDKEQKTLEMLFCNSIQKGSTLKRNDVLTKLNNWIEEYEKYEKHERIKTAITESLFSLSCTVLKQGQIKGVSFSYQGAPVQLESNRMENNNPLLPDDVFDQIKIYTP